MRRPVARRSVAAGVWTLVVLLAACSPAATGDVDGNADPEVALRTFDSCDALTAELRRRGRAQVASASPLGPTAGVTAEAAGVADSAPGGGRAAAWSGTNVQVGGVDEPDVVKSDGTHLYVVADRELHVVDVRDERPRAVATVQLGDGAPRELLLHGARVLVLGDDTRGTGGPDPRASDGPAATLHPMVVARTRLWSVDVSDPAAPRITSTMAVDGGMLTARLTDATARVVIRSLPVLVDPVMEPGVGADAGGAGGRIPEVTVDRWLPQVTVDGRSDAPLVGCTAVRAPARGGDDLGLVTVLSLDLERPTLDADRVDAVLGGADTVYADADSLYVTTSRWPVVLPVEPLPLPPPDSAIPGPPATSTTRPVPEPGVVPSPPTITTEVHRFALDADGATYVASGAVPGTVLNQWALSEHDGHLRVATTVDDGRGRSHSAVHVLRRDGARLVEVGRTVDLGRGERIYAVRYAGALGFVVTFRQIDPLYTLDLSDPASPSVLGELKIPGYSAYLHPVGDHHLLGVGQDAGRDGTVAGMQVSLFDISDLRTPNRVAQVGLGPGTSSPVEYDHRALLSWPDRDLVAVPVERWTDGGTGILVLTATVDGRLLERGLIDLGAGSAGVPVRAMVVEDRLLTVSPHLVTASALDTLEMLGAVRL